MAQRRAYRFFRVVRGSAHSPSTEVPERTPSQTTSLLPARSHSRTVRWTRAAPETSPSEPAPSTKPPASSPPAPALSSSHRPPMRPPPSRARSILCASKTLPSPASSATGNSTKERTRERFWIRRATETRERGGAVRAQSGRARHCRRCNSRIGTRCSLMGRMIM